MRITTISVKSVGMMPSKLEEGILYLSEQYGLSKHLCFCGCGESVVLPLDRWEHLIYSRLPTVEDKRNGISYMDIVTVSPSIGSFSLPCKSHYFIKNNTVEWL